MNMTTQREAVKLAIEAIKSLSGELQQWTLGENYPETLEALSTASPAIEACRLALSQPIEPVAIIGTQYQMQQLEAKIADLTTKHDALKKDLFEANQHSIDFGHAYDTMLDRNNDLTAKLEKMRVALSEIQSMTFDAWTNGSIAKQIAVKALEGV